MYKLWTACDVSKVWKYGKTVPIKELNCLRCSLPWVTYQLWNRFAFFVIWQLLVRLSNQQQGCTELTSSDLNLVQTPKCKPDPARTRKMIWSPNQIGKTNLKLGLKNVAVNFFFSLNNLSLLWWNKIAYWWINWCNNHKNCVLTNGTNVRIDLKNKVFTELQSFIYYVFIAPKTQNTSGPN